MIKVRRGVFETNSSSTHSIAVSKEKVNTTKLPKTIHFDIGEFGWNAEEVNPASYLYTHIVCWEDMTDYYLEELKQFLDRLGVEYTFSEPKYDRYGLIDGYVDHIEYGFVTWVFESEDRLMRYLFGNTHVYTGNDNSCDDFETEYSTRLLACKEAEKWDEDTGYQYMLNPYHDEEKNEYYYKGN